MKTQLGGSNKTAENYFKINIIYILNHCLNIGGLNNLYLNIYLFIVKV